MLTHELISIIDKEKLLINCLVDICNIPEEDMLGYLKCFPNHVSTLKFVLFEFIKKPSTEKHLIHISALKWYAQSCIEALISYDHNQCRDSFDLFTLEAKLFVREFFALAGGTRCEDCGRVCEQKCIDYKNFPTFKKRI